ncbi:GL13629 [Drosophila persimilis]|uniref:Tetratricopeptide repeat protein 12 n=2 Tax=pseudoobscura subgroup TaxID=32358 RepID=A0A6I8UMC5_DROPS|nr:tetratricopeptide repeat protein 12 [Drosophila pseudoobscura]XP_002020206.1 tetratricopeptide repeat protein 12 [Drosophila persimilis]EDW39018.1 GL13629 [Drosophila persimilis]
MTSKGLDDFSEFEATLQKIEDILHESDEKQDAAAAAESKTAVDFDKLDPDNVRLKVRENRTVINRKSLEEDKKNEAGMVQTMNQQSFMQQVEKDANERAESRAKREYEAEVQKSHGNEAFRNAKYEKAILHYGKALAQIKDSAITYNNRALCYIKLRNYKRALQDCQHVVDKLQETNLRAWLYKATAYKRLGQTKDFEESVAKAREHNPKQLAYIEKYIKQMEAET